MGEVYQALDTDLKRQVAIKVLPEAVLVMVLSMSALSVSW